MCPRLLVGAALAAVLVAPSVAAAHIQMTFPTPRTLDQKSRPCGGLNSVRGANVNVFAPGQQIEVVWKETINHPGHYRISFDADGQDFVVPPTANGTTMGMLNVVIDLIADRSTTPANNQYSQVITLPNMTCENCTLQLIQLMTDKPPYTTDATSDDIYHQCADIAIRTPAGVDAGVDAAVSPDAASNSDGGVGADELTGGCGCRTSHPQPVGIATALLTLGIASRRRRRR